MNNSGTRPVIVECFATLYVVVSYAAVVAAFALQASYYAHGQSIGYQTPVGGAEVSGLFRSFRISDLGASVVPLLWITATLVFALLPYRRGQLICRVYLCVPQLILVPLLLLGPLAIWESHFRHFRGLDGEWLGEDWPLMEALGLWAPIPIWMLWKCVVEVWKERAMAKAKEDVNYGSLRS
jgi:hypothetical protein